MTFITGCSFGTECVNHGEIRKHDCTEYECIVTYKGDIQYGIMKPYRAVKYVVTYHKREPLRVGL